jgi:hypothetical protein
LCAAVAAAATVTKFDRDMSAVFGSVTPSVLIGEVDMACMVFSEVAATATTGEFTAS